MTRVSLSQVQIIRSLAEALAWFEKELAWGVQPAELRHLTGRIGELYVAMITQGQMALATNQHGYDVVSSVNERISVKTITTSKQVAVCKSTFQHVDRVVILRINVDEQEASIEKLLDCKATDLSESTSEGADVYVYRVLPAPQPTVSLADMAVVVSMANYDEHRIVQYENGTIIVETNGIAEPQAMPVLRQIATDLGVSLLNSNGNKRNTRQLGAELLMALDA